MATTTIEVETVIDGCGARCADFTIELNTYVLNSIDGKLEWCGHSPECKYINRCRHLIETLEGTDND